TLTPGHPPRSHHAASRSSGARPASMTQTPTRPSYPGHHVTAVLVCHDGARWLPEVLAAIAAQTRPPERFIAADTGSTDGSAALVTAMFGPGSVVALPRGTPLGH